MSDFEPIKETVGWPAERVSAVNKYFAKLNEQSEKIRDSKDDLLNYLEPPSDQRENAWRSIVMTALHYADWKEYDPLAAHRKWDRTYKAARVILEQLTRAEGQDGMTELPDDRLSELLPMLADIVANRPRPKHKGAKSPIPAALIYELAFIFNQYADKEPGAGYGPFSIFVEQFWSMLGNERDYETVVKDIKKARKSRPEAFQQPAAFLKA